MRSVPLPDGPHEAAIALAFLAAVWFWVAHAGRGESARASAVKTASTAGLAVAGLVGGAPAGIVAGLALGSAGDFALSRPGTGWFLAGMAAFAAGHLGYALAFLTGFGALAAPGPAGWAVLAAVVVLVGSTELWLAPHTGPLRVPVRLYGGVIGAMAAAAVLLPDGTGQARMQAGAALFLLSDLVLALRLFRLRAVGARLVASRLLWPAYWGGQALILWGALTAAG
jgi:uncharacterized membrane protein YhhN